MYQIIFKQSANKELMQISKLAISKVITAIGGLAFNPKPVGIKKLKNSSEDLYRIRVGDYRIIYAIEDEIRIINIRKIGHRKDIYR